MIQLNFNILAWYIVIGTIIGSLGRIFLGLTHQKKSEYFDSYDVVLGTIWLIMCICYLIFGTS